MSVEASDIIDGVKNLVRMEIEEGISFEYLKSSGARVNGRPSRAAVNLLPMLEERPRANVKPGCNWENRLESVSY